jgi:hypothetical protein
VLGGALEIAAPELAPPAAAVVLAAVLAGATLVAVLAGAMLMAPPGAVVAAPSDVVLMFVVVLAPSEVEAVVTTVEAPEAAAVVDAPAAVVLEAPAVVVPDAPAVDVGPPAAPGSVDSAVATSVSPGCASPPSSPPHAAAPNTRTIDSAPDRVRERSRPGRPCWPARPAWRRSCDIRTAPLWASETSTDTHGRKYFRVHAPSCHRTVIWHVDIRTRRVRVRAPAAAVTRPQRWPS